MQLLPLKESLHLIREPNRLIMFRNNLKISFRIFVKNKSYTFINILGMSSGLAIAMLIISYVRFELSYEDQNPVADRLVRITMDYLNGETVIDQDAEAYPAMAPRISEEFPDVVNFARAYPINNATLKFGDNPFREDKIYCVDPAFLTLFNCRLLSGNHENLLAEPYEIILTESQALKYFKKTDVEGETLWMSTFNKDFKITGVVADYPPNSHLKYHMLISYSSLEATFGENKNAWSNNDAYTYLLLSHPGKYEQFLADLNGLNDRLHREGKILNERVVAQPVRDIHLYSHKSYEMEQNGDDVSVYFLLGVAILVMVIAVVNYVNLSTAKSLDRAKEVGIRKVVGSSLNQLRIQFFTESFLINFFAALLAIGMMILVLPAFRNMAGLPPGFHFWNDPVFWYTMISAVLSITVLSSVFPALILSSFQPVKVLKGKFSRAARGIILRKALVIVQFSITIFLLIQTFTADRQLNYMRAKDLGLDISRTVVVRSAGNNQGENYQVFKDGLLAHSQFQSVALSSCVPGQPSSELASTNVGVNLVGATEKQSFNFYIYFTDADFIPTMDMELISGENFIAADQSQEKILVNEEAIERWGIPEPDSAIGKRIDLWGAQRTIIGVIRNFHQASAKTAYVPMIFMHTEGNNELISVRIKSGNVKESLALIKDTYSSVFPDSPFDYFFLDQEFDKQYRSEEQFQEVFGTLTAFAIMISCLGLFGLVSFTVANRTKEIGVRKVLGAGITQIMALLSRDFISLVVISMVISISAAYFLIQNWLERYAFRIDMSPWLFIGPASVVLVISVLTIVTKTFGISSVNPVNTLKEE